MLERCRNPNDVHFDRYGGRGVKVCKRWYDFRNFLADMGERPSGLTLDRRDNDGNYEPSNCWWVTRQQQARNRWNSLYVILNGKRVFLKDAARKHGISYWTAVERLRKGWPVDQILKPWKERVQYHLRRHDRR